MPRWTWRACSAASTARRARNFRDVFAATADDRDDTQQLLLARTVYGNVLAQLANDALANEGGEWVRRLGLASPTTR